PPPTHPTFFNEPSPTVISTSINTISLHDALQIYELLDSDEYMENFGYDIVPYYRRRILPGREVGQRPFDIKSPRYDEYYRGILGFPKISWQQEVRRFKPQEKKASAGNPSLYLDMARSVAPRVASAPQVNTATINIGATVPFRKLNVPVAPEPGSES
ncbi:MAG: phycobilisome rod-core linker polypeptide CpcG, partial [Cyanobacteria bacterium J06576_12]